jgi:predicted transposase YbfD/YdcC
LKGDLPMLPDPRPYFSDLPDPRRTTRNKLHKLEDIVMLTLCAVLCGDEDWVSIEDFGHDNEEWLRQFLELSNGIPSHDTLSDVMGRIQPEAFAQAFQAWVQAGLPSLAEQQIAIDGKSLRGSRQGNGMVHMMSAFATHARIVLACQEVPDKTNEISAIPDLLAQLDLTGALVTIDAMGCQKRIAHDIVAQQADYVLALKENHATLYDDVKLWLDTNDVEGHVYATQTIEKDHGRIETRRVVVSKEIDWLPQASEWAGLKAVAMVDSVREIGHKISRERRYYLCSITNVDRIAQSIRQHWAIENQQHWILDVQFGEDAHRTRTLFSAANLALIRRAALNILHADSSNKLSIRRRKRRALANLAYREALLFRSQLFSA